jgi:hypothetical protein
MKNLIKFLIADALFCLLMAFVVIAHNGCNTNTQGNPKRYEVIQSYTTFGTDGELEAIDAHYMSIDGDPDAYGFILFDADNVAGYSEYQMEFSVDVYKEGKGRPYIYEWNPNTGEETKRFLTPKQCQWIIKLNH